MKKWVLALSLLLAVAGAALTGCSNVQEVSGKDGQVEIVLAGWGGNPTETKLLNQTIQDFEKLHPSIHVKHEVITDQYMDILKTRLIGGNGPDVFYLDALEAPGLINTGVLEPLNSYVKSDFDVQDFEKPLLKAFQKNGETYGFPKDYSTLGLFYNKKLFKEAGVEVPKTWGEFEEVSKVFKKKGIQTFGVTPELARIFYMAQANGGDVVKNNKANFATKEVVDALQPLIDQHLKDKTSVQPSDVGANSGTDMFAQQKVAMVIEGNWMIPFLQESFPKLDYGTAEVPTINDHKNTMAFTVAYVMNADSKKKKASWELIQYLTGKEGMETWTSKGYALPTRKSVADKLGFAEDEKRGPLVKGAAYATVWQDGPYLPIIMNNFNNQFLSAFLGQSDLETALKKAQKQANQEISIYE
ncbi:ABC transporter substrate-binding protein [Priestia megaterium]|uniref:ABC transporter substrate-binding protein n=1 Tax=Priestia megaterium TaxID=1404 RepID=UPI001B39DA16|nr:ABC transporter substrate-binding protein [Priestia megaterium]MBQ4865841.1 ABC transporter substrate-binding protein [Priestia megaterium]